MPTERDADYWHLPGSDDLAHIRAQEGRVVVRVLTPRGKEHRWRTKDSFSVWDCDVDDWVRTKGRHRKTWPTVERAERWLAEH